MNYNTNKNNYKKTNKYPNNNTFNNSNNNFNNNSLSFQKNKKIKTDEELSKNIFIHILRINFFNFLKNIKESNRRKLLLINTYFFLVKHAYNPFISNLKLKVKCKKLKEKIKAFQCRKFFTKTKNQINLIKNPNGGKITTVHAYLYYFNKLKQKLIKGLKINIKLNKLNNQRILLLFGIRNKISILYLYREMRKKFINKESKLYEKTCIFIRTRYLKYLIDNKKKSTEIEEGYRLIRRYQYINNIKDIMNHFNVNYLRKLNKDCKNLEKQKKYFLVKKGIKMLKKFSKTKKKYDNIHNKIIDKTKFNFLQRVKHKISNKVIMNRNFNFLYGVMKKLYKKRYYPELYKRINKFCLNTKGLTKLLMKKIGVGYLKIRTQQKKFENLKLYKIKAKFKKEQMRNGFEILKSNIKLYALYRKNNNISLFYLKKKCFIKIINGLKINKQMKRKKRTMILKAKRFNEKMNKKKIIEKWKLYIMYQKNKRNEYLYAINKRNEIITKHLIQNLINISSENPNMNNMNNINNINNFNHINNNIIDDKSIMNSSFGSQLMFGNKNINNNKNDYYLNDSNNSNSNNIIEKNEINNNNINDDIKSINNINIKKDNNIFDDLKEIRNKKRSKPVILDLNSL